MDKKELIEILDRQLADHKKDLEKLVPEMAACPDDPYIKIMVRNTEAMISKLEETRENMTV